MNMSDARSKLTSRGWTGEFRPVWSATYMTVGKPDRPDYFKTAFEAECAAWRALRNIEQPVMTRGGDKCQAQRAKAESLFKQGRKITIERKAVQSQPQPEEL